MKMLWFNPAAGN